MKLLYLVGTCVATFAPFQLFAQGYIVPNGVTDKGFHLGGYEFDVVYDPVHGFTTGFLLEPNGKTPPSGPFDNTFRFDPIANVGVRVFFVSPNDPISSQLILSGNYSELTFPNSYVFDVGTPLYVGLYTGNQPFAPPDGIYTDPLFGWAELVNNNGVIELVDSALEYQGGGIYAGTLNIIPAPEPSTVGILCVSGLVFGLFRCRRK